MVFGKNLRRLAIDCDADLQKIEQHPIEEQRQHRGAAWAGTQDQPLHRRADDIEQHQRGKNAYGAQISHAGSLVLKVEKRRAETLHWLYDSFGPLWRAATRHQTFASSP